MKKSGLRHHQNVEHEFVEVKCKECYKMFSKNRLLKNYIMNTHKSLKEFKCNLCEYSCNSKSNLKSHVVSIHDKSKNFDAYT